MSTQDDAYETIFVQGEDWLLLVPREEPCVFEVVPDNYPIYVTGGEDAVTA